MAKKKAARPETPAKKQAAKKTPTKKAPAKKAAAKRAPAKKAAKKKTKRKPPPKAKTRQGKSNTASVRNELTGIEFDNKVVAMYREGHGPSAIAQKMGLHVQQVQRSVQRIRARWREESIAGYEDAVARSEAIFSHIMTLSFDAYRESLSA